VWRGRVVARPAALGYGRVAVFESVEIGRKLSKTDFKEREDQLRAELVVAQREARDAGIPVIVIVSGVEGAGKGQVVNQLMAWCDPRGMHIHAIWDETSEEQEKPRWWRFWRRLPPRGSIGVLFGSWYTAPIVDRAFDKIDEAEFQAKLAQIEAFERMLWHDGAVIVKLWFHITHDTQLRRYEEDERTTPGRWKLPPANESYMERYEKFRSVSETAIRATDTGRAPWHLIEAENPRYRDLSAGLTVLSAIRAQLDQPRSSGDDAVQPPVPLDLPGARTTVLDQVDLSASLSKKDYKAQLEAQQRRLHHLAWANFNAGRSVVAVFEGWDAGGKGGAIRRAAAAVDARLIQVVPVAAPTDEERAQHYLWRFWRHLPRAGRITMFDRSWYGRVLVERVEGFAKPSEWMRSYHEINEFEEQLVDHGIVVCKFWLHIDQDEQARRFEERTQIAWKQHKITEEDWRNRERWADYELAVHDMVEKTSTQLAPWTLVPGNDKRFARIKVLETLCDAIERAS
jgi:polyphosphate:AMP phosphotransferase